MIKVPGHVAVIFTQCLSPSTTRETRRRTSLLGYILVTLLYIAALFLAFPAPERYVVIIVFDCEITFMC
jgi:hypothetical protein